VNRKENAVKKVFAGVVLLLAAASLSAAVLIAEAEKAPATPPGGRVVAKQDGTMWKTFDANGKLTAIYYKRTEQTSADREADKTRAFAKQFVADAMSHHYAPTTGADVVSDALAQMDRINSAMDANRRASDRRMAEYDRAQVQGQDQYLIEYESSSGHRHHPHPQPVVTPPPPAPVPPPPPSSAPIQHGVGKK
jgi:hypothetical protein